MYSITENELKNFTITAFKTAEKSLNTYSNKYSKHNYTQQQLTALLCLKKRLRLRYRDLILVVDLMPEIRESISLKKIPHFTTLQKFFDRLGSRFFEEILKQTVKLFDIRKPWVAVDGTGHKTDQASLYYSKKQGKKRKNYTKNQIAIDTEKQVILSQKVAKGPRHDMKDAIPTVRKTNKYKPSGFVMDKAFDSEQLHKVINEELKAESMIPPKKRIKKGDYRLNMLETFDETKYRRRSLVETVISVEKRVFGDVNTSRSDRLRNKESKLRNICYNIYKHSKSFLD